MDIVFKSIHRFDLDSTKVLKVSLPKIGDDFDTYLNELLEDVLASTRSRRYVFPEDETATKGLINNVMLGHVDKATLDAAKRLLRIEVNVQKRIEKLEQEVQKGILLQALVEHDNIKYYIIAKAEHLDFINEDDNKKAKGLPIKKKIFKSFCAKIGDNGEVDFALVGDSKASISYYWWNTFLELIEEHTNDYNTTAAFDALDGKIFSKMRKKFPEDYLYLRNSTVQFFRSNTDFIIDEYLDKVIRNYEPEDPTLKVKEVEEKILKLPDSENFDSRFEIVKGLLKKKIITTIKLTQQLVLELKENIDLIKTVTAFEEEGFKYIKIRTEEGYKYFKKN